MSNVCNTTTHGQCVAIPHQANSRPNSSHECLHIFTMFHLTSRMRTALHWWQHDHCASSWHACKVSIRTQLGIYSSNQLPSKALACCHSTPFESWCMHLTHGWFLLSVHMTMQWRLTKSTLHSAGASLCKAQRCSFGSSDGRTRHLRCPLSHQSLPCDNL